MNNNTVYLEASGAGGGDILNIGISPKLDDPISQYKAISVSLSKIENRCLDMIEFLNNAGRKGGQGQRVSERLREMGQMLSNELLTPDLREKLSRSEAEYLILKLDDHLVHIPWELLYVSGGFLCECFKVGRLVKTRQEIAESQDRCIPSPMKMWIIANPRNDLASADEEGENICDDMDMMNQDHKTALVDTYLDSAITPDSIKERLKTYDFVHFAGHADFIPHEAGQSGWRVSDGIFKADDVHRMMGSNACQSARTEAWKDSGAFGLANAFMLAGVKHYIGTGWDIMDEPSSRFAQNFYKHLLSGKTTGEAVHQARQDLIAGGDEICWASYLLYGDPRAAYFDPKDSSDRFHVPIEKEKQVSADSKKNTLRSEEVLPIQPNMIYSERDKGGRDKSPTARLNFNFKRIGIGLCLMIILAIAALVIYYHYRETIEPPGILTMAVVFDPEKDIFDEGKKHIITGALELELKTYPRVKLVERDPLILEWIMKEIEFGKGEDIDPEHRIKSQLLTARLILHFKVVKEDGESGILMRLIDIKRGTIEKILFVKIENSLSILKQKENLSKELLRYLRDKYPIWGNISEINDEGVILNIGTDAGVALNQQFQIVGTDTILEILGVGKNSSTAAVKQGKMPKKGDRVQIKEP
jgi:CHAT domain-containing protein